MTSNPVKEEAVTLLPCPFCAGPGHMEFSEYDLSDGYHVICHGKKTCPLFCSDPYCVFDTEAEAIAAWNTRQADPRIAELEAALEARDAEVGRLQRAVWSNRQIAKRRGKDLLHEEANEALPHFRPDWEPLRDVAARTGRYSASQLASRARDLQARGLVESKWLGPKERTQMKVWRKGPGRLPPITTCGQLPIGAALNRKEG